MVSYEAARGGVTVCEITGGTVGDGLLGEVRNFMNILLIKQTSLGDVVHATAPIRSVRMAHPDAVITVLTSTTASDILRNNPDVDHLLTFDRYRVKSHWWRRPLWTIGHFMSTLSAVREQRFDLALDLQGSWKTVIFLWASRADRRFVKGRWWFARRFHQPMAHAVDELWCRLSLSRCEKSNSRRRQSELGRALTLLPLICYCHCGPIMMAQGPKTDGHSLPHAGATYVRWERF